jgi:hypothetical protein
MAPDFPCLRGVDASLKPQEPSPALQILYLRWKVKKLAVLAPFLAVTASVSFLYLSSQFAAPPGAIIRPLLVSWVILLGMELPAYWLTRNRKWASLVLVIVVAGLFASFEFAAVMLFGSLAMTALLWVAFRGIGRKLKLFHLLMAVNGLHLAIVLLCGASVYQLNRSIPPSYYENLPGDETAVTLTPSSSYRPDIYYIIVDGYGREDVLKELYGFDNFLFLDQLRESGFIIPGQSRSNYMRTVLSLTSSLNMEYIDTLAPGLEDSGFWWLMSPWLDHSRVRTALEEIGYSSISISSGWELTDNQAAGQYLASHPVMLNEFEKRWLAGTPLELFEGAFEKALAVPTYQAHRYTQLYELEALSTVVHRPAPKFVFVHILMPHPPFVFLADGTPVDPPYPFTLSDANDYSGSHSEYRAGYLAQLQFLNNRLAAAIQKILLESKQPPIIILQSDHGPGMRTDFSAMENSCLAERFSNFFAFYLPGIDPGTIPQDITPVNLFRFLFNDYFDANLEILENKNYFSTHPGLIYRVQDVTDRVGTPDLCRTESPS